MPSCWLALGSLLEFGAISVTVKVFKVRKRVFDPDPRAVRHHREFHVLMRQRRVGIHLLSPVLGLELPLQGPPCSMLDAGLPGPRLSWARSRVLCTPALPQPDLWPSSDRWPGPSRSSVQVGPPIRVQGGHAATRVLIPHCLPAIGSVSHSRLRGSSYVLGPARSYRILFRLDWDGS